MNLAEKIPKNNYRYRLKAFIHRIGYEKQADFCMDHDISPATLSRILHGYFPPNSDTLEKIAKGLNISIRELRQLL